MINPGTMKDHPLGNAVKKYSFGFIPLGIILYEIKSILDIQVLLRINVAYQKNLSQIYTE